MFGLDGFAAAKNKIPFYFNAIFVGHDVCVCVVEINGWISTRSVVHTGALSMLRQAARICSKLTGPSGRSINVARLLV